MQRLECRGCVVGYLQGASGLLGLPATVNEDLSTKPSVQEEFLRIFNASGPIPTPQMKRNYLNFYGNL
ncbi:MAG TPA: hypothetical protein VIJ82_08800, partial [Streptosporangiaceae bacterium]